MIGVAIPCYKKHIPLLKRCLDSIEAQTRKPDYVIVHSSSSEEEDIPKYSYSFPLEVIAVPIKLNASQNRNAAAAYLEQKGCSYISFFDADDAMHPQRIEAIQYALHKYPLTQLLVHNCGTSHDNTLQSFQMIPDYDLWINQLVPVEKSNCIGIPNKPEFHVHHGHVTVAAEILHHVGFPEDIFYSREGQTRGIEDALFCQTVLEMNVQTVYISNPLSIYYPSVNTV